MSEKSSTSEITASDLALSPVEMETFVTELRESGFSAGHVAMICVLSDPGHGVTMPNPGKIKTILEKDYQVALTMREIREALRDKKLIKASNRAFARLRSHWMRGIEMNMILTAADPTDRLKVQAATLLMKKDGAFKPDEGKVIDGDPAARLVQQLNSLKLAGVVKIHPVTGEVTILGSTEITSQTTTITGPTRKSLPPPVDSEPDELEDDGTDDSGTDDDGLGPDTSVDPGP
jgi:hypothetical protein